MAVTFQEMLNEHVALYVLNGVKAAYIDLRVIRSTVPEGVHVYEVRDTSDDGGYYLGNVEDSVLVNHAGTFFTAEPLGMLHPDYGVYIDMAEDDEPWESVDGSMTLRAFLEAEGGIDA